MARQSALLGHADRRPDVKQAEAAQTQFLTIPDRLAEDRAEIRQGFAVTRPLRTIADLAAAESTSRDIVEQALIEGRRSGVITALQISRLGRNPHCPLWFQKLLGSNVP